MSDAPLTVGRHSRSLEGNRYVYAVLSRRSRGISVGINLNPDKVCNFGCVYCQVDRNAPPSFRGVEESILAEELESVLERARDGRLFRAPPFDSVPAPLRRLADIAFAGDGEVSTFPGLLPLAQGVFVFGKTMTVGGHDPQTRDHNPRFHCRLTPMPAITPEATGSPFSLSMLTFAFRFPFRK